MPGAEPLPDILRAVADAVEPLRGGGEVARYIPALARVDPRRFAMAVATVEGGIHAVGDADEPFSAQSITKVFALALALERRGDALWTRVGREPSGSPFNSLVALEYEGGVPRNPFINAGALVLADVLVADGGGGHPVLAFARERAASTRVRIDAEVARSEREHGHRNAALASLMKDFGNIEHRVEEVLEFYFAQCALAMSCSELARSTLFLAAAGRDPASGARVLDAQAARRINALMLTCGHYDGSGEFAFRVGLPGKSGVGGGIVAVVPGVLSAAVWSPGLDANGNSLAGTRALELFAQRTGYSLFRGPTERLAMHRG